MSAHALHAAAVGCGLLGVGTVVSDPRRPGVAMALITCVGCGRAYTLTPEVARAYLDNHTWPCPDRDCGKGGAGC